MHNNVVNLKIVLTSEGRIKDTFALGKGNTAMCPPYPTKDYLQGRSSSDRNP
ncbi:MAG: hypothetical protein ACYTXE_36245 [Nostoc sp.]